MPISKTLEIFGLWVRKLLVRALGLHLLYEPAFKAAMKVVELDLVPDFIIRRAIRYLVSLRLDKIYAGTVETQLQRKQAFIQELKQLPVAVQTDEANEQHYEVPTQYFLLALGKHLKYSSCLYKTPNDKLEEAEEHMLSLYCERAQLKDGQDVLELGCGWGSLSLFLAERYPASSITAVSNSRTQKELIMQRCKERGINNLQVITANMVSFQAPSTYDRIVTIEMFEHMKNYEELMKRCASWLKPSGMLFVHIFVHKYMPYHFEVEGEDDWMAKYFFSGGTMPSLDLLLYFQQHLSILDHWYIDGTHYSRTLEDWLRKQDKHRATIMPIFKKTYGEDQGLKWFVYWRLFYLACSELFNYSNGEEFGVGHFLFVKK